MKVFHGTSKEMLAEIENEGVSAPSYWAGDYEQAKGYADSFSDGVVLVCDSDEYDFKANMLVAQCLVDSGDMPKLPSETDLVYSLEFLEGIVCHDVVRNWSLAENVAPDAKNLIEKSPSLNDPLKNGDTQEWRHAMDPAWRKEIFEPFVAAMEKAGFTNDGGVNYGQYGIGLYHRGEIAVVAWCYPPDQRSLNTIIVRGGAPGETKKASFNFNSAGDMQKALDDSLVYVGSRAAEGIAAIDKLKNGTLLWSKNMGMKPIFPEIMRVKSAPAGECGRPGKYYGTIDKSVGDVIDLAAMGIHDGGFNEQNQCFVVSFNIDALMRIAASGVNYNVKATWRYDDAGQTPHHMMSAEQLEAEIAYYDFMFASSVPYSPNTATRDDWYAENGGFGSRPHVPSAMDFMRAREDARRCLAAKTAAPEQPPNDESVIQVVWRRMKP